MALIKEVRGKSPLLHDSVWLAENATVVGDVKMDEGCSVWFSAVVRGDVNKIVLGKNVNVQDGAVIHCTYEKSQTIIGDNVSIGHNAIVHGCMVRENVLIGMGSIIMDNAIVPENVIIAAGAIVLEGSELESNSIYAGIPARKVKSLSSSAFKENVVRIANNYKTYAGWFENQ